MSSLSQLRKAFQENPPGVLVQRKLQWTPKITKKGT